MNTGELGGTTTVGSASTNKMTLGATNHAQRRSTSALFSRVSRVSDRAITRLNNSAVNGDMLLPAFYCVHSVSGVAGTDFLDLASYLDGAVRFYGIQAPVTRMGNANFGKSVDALADYYADELMKFQPTGPIMLGGYCIGAVIALAIANTLRARGRDVGPLVAIDGVPENTRFALRRWHPRYWWELFGNLKGWVNHADLMRTRTLRSLTWSISNNLSAISKGLLGLNKAQRFGGGYGVESMMDVSRFTPTHLQFVNRLMAALFAFTPKIYDGEVVVYEAGVKPLLSLPQIGRIWGRLAARTEVVVIIGTHISMIHDPYVDALANDLDKRIARYCAPAPASPPVNVSLS